MKKWHKVLIGIVILLIALFVIAIPKFNRHMESVTCGNFMAPLCFAATVWADDHEGYMPTNLTGFGDAEIGIPPSWLICPSDHLRKPALGWTSFNPTNSSYEIVTVKMRSNETNTVFLRCKIHGHLGYPYGYLFDGVERRTKKNF